MRRKPVKAEQGSPHFPARPPTRRKAVNVRPISTEEVSACEDHQLYSIRDVDMGNYAPFPFLASVTSEAEADRRDAIQPRFCASPFPFVLSPLPCRHL